LRVSFTAHEIKNKTAANEKNPVILWIRKHPYIKAPIPKNEVKIRAIDKRLLVSIIVSYLLGAGSLTRPSPKPYYPLTLGRRAAHPYYLSEISESLFKPSS
jgi:hypothetical protein